MSLATALLPQLRHATVARHRLVEDHVVMRPLRDPHLTQGSYLLALEALLRAFRPIDAAIEASLNSLPAPTLPAGFEYVPRAPLLQADIADLTAGLALPSQTEPRLALSPEALPGVLYVMEGATMGGRMLAPQLQRALSLPASRGTRYWQLYQHGHWPRVRQWLQQPFTTEVCQASVSSAVAAFGQIHAACNAVARRHGATEA